MNKQDIRIVKLSPMRVASAYGFGDSPEELALAKMSAFMEGKDLYETGMAMRTYGFNNPNPSAGSSNYGYEVWLPVRETVEPIGDIRIHQFAGGLYAVSVCRGLQHIGERWSELAKWREGSQYVSGRQQWLEHLLSPLDTPADQLLFDLYLPIAE